MFSEVLFLEDLENEEVNYYIDQINELEKEYEDTHKEYLLERIELLKSHIKEICTVLEGLDLCGMNADCEFLNEL